MDGGVGVGFTRIEDHRGEIRLVYGIGEVLGLQAESVVLMVDFARLSGEFSIEEIAGVELDTGFGGGDFHDASGCGFEDFGKFFEGTRIGFVEDPIVVEAGRVASSGFDVASDAFGFGEIHDASIDRDYGSDGDECFVGRCVVGGIEGEDVLVDIAISFARQVEIRMVGQVDRSGLIGGRLIIDPEFIVIGERIGDVDVEISWVSFFSVGAQVVEFDGDSIGGFDFSGVPDAFVETFIAAMQVVGAIICGESILFSIE